MQPIQLLLSQPSEPIAPCASRFWGNPDLPADMDYPTYMDSEGQPCEYQFICQINLAEVAPYDTQQRLPHKGLLSFFAKIDHYLGKDTVQNILMLRFANLIFEPVWNAHYIDHIQLTVAETLGVEHRAGYYDQYGLLRDMFQNHMLEMLAMAAMEMPASFSPDAVRDEKVKLIKAIRPFDLNRLGDSVIRAQYDGYRAEPGVAPDSRTETFVAARLLIDNWRWAGVPFYLRSGKRLAARKSEIAIVFKSVPHSIFEPIRAADMQPDTLVLKVQPDEGMELTIQAKQPGPKLCMGGLSLNFRYSELPGGESFEAYERLLLDAMLGDQTLFIRSDVIAGSWRLFTPVLENWQEKCPLAVYAPGSEGPEEAARLLFREGREWRPL